MSMGVIMMMLVSIGTCGVRHRYSSLSIGHVPVGVAGAGGLRLCLSSVGVVLVIMAVLLGPSGCFSLTGPCIVDMCVAVNNIAAAVFGHCFGLSVSS